MVGPVDGTKMLPSPKYMYHTKAVRNRKTSMLTVNKNAHQINPLGPILTVNKEGHQANATGLIPVIKLGRQSNENPMFVLIGLYGLSTIVLADHLCPSGLDNFI